MKASKKLNLNLPACRPATFARQARGAHQWSKPQTVVWGTENQSYPCVSERRHLAKKRFTLFFYFQLTNLLLP